MADATKWSAAVRRSDEGDAGQPIRRSGLDRDLVGPVPDAEWAAVPRSAATPGPGPRFRRVTEELRSSRHRRWRA